MDKELEKKIDTLEKKVDELKKILDWMIRAMHAGQSIRTPITDKSIISRLLDEGKHQ